MNLTSIVFKKIRHDTITAEITFRGRKYMGYANLDPKDKDIQSDLVGQHIALERAEIAALKDFYESTKKEVEIKYQLYNELTGYGEKAIEEVDPTDAVTRNVVSAQIRMIKIKKELKKKQKELNKYLSSLDKMKDSIAKIRAKANNKVD